MSDSSLPEVLLCGVDRLELGLYTTVDTELLERLDEAWAQHQDSLHPELEIEIGGRMHDVRRIGSGGYRYALVRPHAYVALLRRPNPHDPAPGVYLQVRSELLWHSSPAGAVHQICDVLFPNVAPRPDKMVPGYVELCCDWRGFEMQWEDTPNFVRRVRVLNAHWDPGEDARERLLACIADAVRDCLAAGWPVEDLPRLVPEAALSALRGQARTHFDEAELEGERQSYMRQWSRGQLFTGWSFGKGDLGGRLYRKDVEIRQESKKYWFFDLWAFVLAPTSSSDRAAILAELKEEPIWRLEFKLRRPALKEFRIESLEDLVKQSGAFWHYLAGDWLTLRVPGRSRRSNWPVDPRWEHLASRSPSLESKFPLIRDRVRRLNRDHATALATGALSTIVALDSRADVLERLSVDAAATFTAQHVKQRLKDRDESFPERVAAARERNAEPIRSRQVWPRPEV